MSIATNKSILAGMKGKLGGIVARQVNGKTVLSTLPDRDKPKTKKQSANHNLFREASAFAKEACKDPEIRAFFVEEARRRKLTNPYTAALSFRLKELKAPQNLIKTNELKAAEVSTPAPISASTTANSLNPFKQELGLHLDLVESALHTIDQVLNSMQNDALGTQKEVMFSALRDSIFNSLASVIRDSKTGAIDFKMDVPDMEKIREKSKTEGLNS